MGNSIGPPSLIGGGRVTHALSGSVITISERDGRMIHTLSERGLDAEYPVAYQVGSGKLGYTYMVRIGDYLLESPVSWYRPHGWDVSPGYESKKLLDFDRVMESTCLFCHTDRAVFTDADGRRVSGDPLTPIGCDRCHGPVDEHVRHPSAKNIINPAKLPVEQRNSVCEQCHLEGEIRVLNPGKRWLDFHAGDLFENTAATYLLTNSGVVHAVNQVEQLGQSKCAQGSGGKLWCATCHDPHQQTLDRGQQVRDICVSCHASLSKTAHPVAPAECVSCHMPRLTPNDIAHTASTDHRILRRPAPPLANPDNADVGLRVWREPPMPFRARDLALATNLVALKNPALRDEGVLLLEELPRQAVENDPETLFALAGLATIAHRPDQALALSRAAAEKDPGSALAAYRLAIALQKSGDAGGCEKELLRATDIDPSLQEAWMALTLLYDEQRRDADLIATMDRYLRWNPQNIMFRLERARITGK